VLTLNEIENLIQGFAERGFKKVRLTGGEPTLRQDIVEIVQVIAQTPGIETVALTTNGYRLDTLVKPLRDAGLKAVNISLDSLDAERFRQITGTRSFDRVRSGVDSALRAGIERVKINAVLLRSFIEKDLPAFLRLVQDTDISVRFIELMETGTNKEYFVAEHVSGDYLRSILHALGWSDLPRGALDGPAVELRHPGCAGRLGIIAPYSKDFCASCNRLRVSSRGKLKLCLFGDGELSLRGMLQSPDQRDELFAALGTLIGEKAPSHRLQEGIYGSTQHLAGIGG